MTREEATRRNIMPNELKLCPFCGGNAEEVFLKREKTIRFHAAPLQYALCIHTV